MSGTSMHYTDGDDQGTAQRDPKTVQPDSSGTASEHVAEDFDDAGEDIWYEEEPGSDEEDDDTATGNEAAQNSGDPSLVEMIRRARDAELDQTPAPGEPLVSFHPGERDQDEMLRRAYGVPPSGELSE